MTNQRQRRSQIYAAPREKLFEKYFYAPTAEKILEEPRASKRKTPLACNHTPDSFDVCRKAAVSVG